MSSESGGAKANKSGKAFENRVWAEFENIFDRPVYNYSEWDMLTGQSKNAPKYIKECPFVDKDDAVILAQAPYVGVKTEKRTIRDFIVVNSLGEKTEADMKNQNVAGSCDEKPEAALLNMWESDCKRGIVVLSGDYYEKKKADVRDLKNIASKLAATKSGKTLLVFMENEFYDYLENNKEIL